MPLLWAGTSILFLAYGQIHARNLTRFGGERFAMPSMGHSMQTVLLNPSVDGQIHVCNPKGSGGKRFAILSLCPQSIAKSMHVTPQVRRKEICYVTSQRMILSTCSHEIPNSIWNRGLCLPCGRRVQWAQRRVTATNPESGTAGTRTWRWRMSLCR